MLGIEYCINTGLYKNIIMAMLHSEEIKEFIDKIQTHSFIYFKSEDGADVNLCEKPDEAASVHLHLNAAKVREITDAANGLLKYHIPAHIYIDLDDGYQIMISNNEYPKALARANAEPGTR
jgi:hypothetical protein